MGSPHHFKSRSPYLKILNHKKGIIARGKKRDNYCKKWTASQGVHAVAREQQSVPSFALTDLLILELRV